MQGSSRIGCFFFYAGSPQFSNFQKIPYMRKQFFLILFIALAIASCKKSKEAPSLRETMTTSRWAIRSLTLESPLGANPVDITATTFKDCEMDDPIEFKTTGVFSCKDSGSICIPANNSIFYSLDGGSWELSGDTSLVLKKGFNQQNYRIKSFTTTSVEFYQQEKNYLDELVRYTFTLRAVN